MIVKVSMDSCDAGTYYCALAACGEKFYLEDGIRENNEQQTTGINKTTYTVYKLYFIDCMDIVRDVKTSGSVISCFQTTVLTQPAQDETSDALPIKPQH